jgi:hypothetical protein
MCGLISTRFLTPLDIAAQRIALCYGHVHPSTEPITSNGVLGSSTSSRARRGAKADVPATGHPDRRGEAELPLPDSAPERARMLSSTPSSTCPPRSGCFQRPDIGIELSGVAPWGNNGNAGPAANGNEFQRGIAGTRPFRRPHATCWRQQCREVDCLRGAGSRAWAGTAFAPACRRRTRLPLRAIPQRGWRARRDSR